MAKVIIRIDPTGGTRAKVEGQAGAGCKDLTRALEEALGSVTDDVNTDEYYEDEEEAQRHVQH